MSKVIKLRVLVDYVEDDVFRDIVLYADSTFEELHIAIQHAFAFDNQHMASFYKSDDRWEKGDEITLMDMSESGTPIMSETIVGEHLTEPGQKMLYVFDFFLMWCFFVEVVAIGPAEPGTDYPDISVTHGAAPAQYSKEPPMMHGDFSESQSEDPHSEDGNIMNTDSLFSDFDDPTRFN